MTPMVLAAVAGTGTYLVVTCILLGWRAPLGPRLRQGAMSRRITAWLAQAGLGGIPRGRLLAAPAAGAVVGAGIGTVLFVALVPSAALALAGAAAPVAVHRQRRARRRAEASDAWPRLLDELRVLTAAAGRSVPQALFDAGRRAPEPLRAAFEHAHRTWLLTTDFDRTLAVLKDQLADPTCDMTCETLLVAHDLGGADLDRRLAALAEDRRRDAQDRKDARARQAGVRFARRFVLLVPAGMAMAGLSVGTGQAAYRTAAGQLAVAIGVGLTATCWWWSGRILRLPDERRVFR